LDYIANKEFEWFIEAVKKSSKLCEAVNIIRKGHRRFQQTFSEELCEEIAVLAKRII